MNDMVRDDTTVSLGKQLKIRSMVYVAAEPVPYFWPMRAFIHHNPLHGLESLPFDEAVKKGSELFHGRVFLTREGYQDYLAQGKVDIDRLESEVKSYLADQPDINGLNLAPLLIKLMINTENPAMLPTLLASADDIRTAMASPGQAGSTDADVDDLVDIIKNKLRQTLLHQHTVYEAVDLLYGTDIADNLDELVVKSCLDFFDEGQSVWSMPNRENGFFMAWREVALRNIRLFLQGLHINEILARHEEPEDIINYVMNQLGIPEDQWVSFFTHDIARLHGWAGFIRWRANAKHYYWTQKYPANLVDYLAVRLTLAYALLSKRERRFMAGTTETISQLIEERPQEAYLRYELYSRGVMPAMAHQIETALLSNNESKLNRVFTDYVKLKRADEARRQANALNELFTQAGIGEKVAALSAGNFARLLDTLRGFEQQEGMCWLRAMESHAMAKLVQGINVIPEPAREKRPFVQALFCIDTRSERIRRQLEAIGDYQTFGIAGFFGVPVSFMELGKGSETHLCPVILTPKNLVLEMSMHGEEERVGLGALEKALHSLKESVLTPFVTVEAIGLLFGFDMVGKTVAPRVYHQWRKHLDHKKPTTRLLLDKLTREQADSIVRAVQRAVIVKAMELELGQETEMLTDELIRDLREGAMGHDDAYRRHAETLGVSEDELDLFIQRLYKDYRINTYFAQLQMERLARIGFTLDEQVRFVSTALTSIGLTKDYSRFILLVGHGSQSDNNPYESALDCGACGGSHGIVSARVLAQMANKSDVRKRLNEQGFNIPDDAWFVPAQHNTTTDEITVSDIDLLPPRHLVYLDRLRKGLTAAARLCAQERLPTLDPTYSAGEEPAVAHRMIQRNAVDWSQVRPEWGLSGNAYFVIGNRELTRLMALNGRAFLHSYNYTLDNKRRLLENILTGPLVVGQWINMEHYFSAVDNERFGSGSKVYHNVAGHFGVMTGNISDLRTGLPAQTVLEDGKPYHQPLRLITVIEAPLEHAVRAIDAVVAVKTLVRNGWIRMMIVDPVARKIFTYEDGDWQEQDFAPESATGYAEESYAT